MTKDVIRDRQTNVRLTKKEKELFQACARQSRSNLSEWLRQAVWQIVESDPELKAIYERLGVEW